MLILFDIDGTLLLSHGAGLRAMAEAGRRIVGPGFTMEGVEFAGRIDPQIWNDAARANGVDDAEAQHDAFRALYAEILAENLDGAETAHTLPGVEALVERLAGIDDLTLGLLTGNYAETGRLKIIASGLDPALFPVSAWGSDGRERRDLPAVALRRYREHTGRACDPGRALVIGDTPHDIDCARAGGCPVLAVATGPAHGLAELEAHEPDLAVADLADTARLLEWMGEAGVLGPDAGRAAPSPRVP